MDRECGQTVPIVNKQMSNNWKTCSSSLRIREMYTIISPTCPIRLAKSKEIDNTMLQEHREPDSLVPCLCDYKIAQFVASNLAIFIIILNGHALDPLILLLGIDLLIGLLTLKQNNTKKSMYCSTDRISNNWK